MNKVVWVSSINGDWEGYYDVDGLLADEGHSISGFRVLEYYSTENLEPFELIWEEAKEWLQLEGNLPQKLSDFYEKQEENND